MTKPNHNRYDPATMLESSGTMRVGPLTVVPFGARGAGRYRVCSGWWQDMNLPLVHLAWGLEGHGQITIEDREWILRPGDVAISLPNTRNYPRALDVEWEFCWLGMDGPLAAAIVKGLRLGCGVQNIGPCPTAMFDELISAMLDVSRAGEVRASTIAYQILGRVAALLKITSDRDELVEKAIEIICDEWNNADLNVNALSRWLGVNRTSLYRRFLASVGRTPVSYIGDMRVQNALMLLKQTQLPLKEIASRCGFSDPHYFSRLVRQRVGVSPREFRNNG